jgi:alpha-1,2-mannosyltransferase
MGVSLIILSLLLSVIISAVFLPKILRFGAELLGHQLRRSSRTRRELLLARVASETKRHEAEQKNKKKEDDDWEEVGNTASNNKSIAGKADSEWDGIVGFFHPFWYGL